MKYRPIIFRDDRDVSAKNVEINFRHVDDRFAELFRRLNGNISLLSSGATTDDIIDKVNEIINLLNGN